MKARLRRQTPQEVEEPEEEEPVDIEECEDSESQSASVEDEGAGDEDHEENGQGHNSNSYSLRTRNNKNIFDALKLNEKDLKGCDSPQDDEFRQGDRSARKRSRKRMNHREEDEEYGRLNGDSLDLTQIYDEKVVYDKLPKKRIELEKLLDKVKAKILGYKKQFVEEQIQLKQKASRQLQNSIPICADVTNFDFQLLRTKQLDIGQRLFDVIMMDPPWKLSTSQPSRGVAIQYDSLMDEAIEAIPIKRLQTDGFICVWYISQQQRAINAKYRFTCKLIQRWGYKVVDQVTWVKKTVNGKIAKGHGYYLQHAKESCIIGVKGNVSSPRFKTNVASDVIFSERRGQSQKPTQMYEYIEKLVPNGFYLQIFGRRNNLRNNWVTIGNQL